MAYPITGELGKVNSVTNGTDLDQVLEVALKNVEIRYSIDADVEDITGDGETTVKKLAGLRSWGFDFEGLYPKSAPRFGNTGLVTYASGYAQYVESWSLDFDFGELDITEFSSSPSWRAFRPAGLVEITGSYTARAANDTALSLPSAVNGTGASATFKLTEDGVSDPAFTGDIIVNQLGTSFGRGRELVRAEYAVAFSNTCTSVAGSTLPAILPAGGVDAADWGDGTTGPGTVQIVTQSATGRTYTGYGFLRRLRVECAVGSPIRVTGSVRGQGALTLA